MKIITVRDKKGWKLFHHAPHEVYRNDPNWICPLEKDVSSVFDPEENAALRRGEAKLWVLLEEDGRPVGRIAAFIDYARNEALPYPVGGVGFFECTDRRDYAFALFERAEAYLAQRGARAIDGPINFGERDKFWGLLVKGFYPPLFQENYNPPYYRQFFEQWGFEPHEQIFTLKGKPSTIPLDRLGRVVERIKKNHDLHLEPFSYANIDRMARDFCYVYNAAFGDKEHFKPIEPQQVIKILRQARPIADEHLLGIAYFEGQPAGFCAFFPDINPLLKKNQGKLNWLNMPAFLWRKKTARKLDIKGMGFGIHPGYKSKGMFAFLTYFMTTPHNIETYENMYLATVRAHNEEAIRAYQKLNVHIDRVHLGYRKAIAPGVEVKPFPFVMEV